MLVWVLFWEHKKKMQTKKELKNKSQRQHIIHDVMWVMSWSHNLREKLLCSLVVQQQILYLLPDDSRVNRLRLRWVFVFTLLWAHWCHRCLVGTFSKEQKHFCVLFLSQWKCVMTVTGSPCCAVHWCRWLWVCKLMSLHVLDYSHGGQSE